MPATTLLDQADRAGQMNKLGPVDPDLARNLADKIARNPQSGICMTITGIDGRPVGHACGTPARGDPAASRTSKRKGYGTWRLTYAGRDLTLNFENITGECDHRHETASHDPGKHLKHLTAVLNQECTFGTCRTPEHRTDYEHAVPWPQGRTCWCNGHPCCRRNHQDKQSDGWHVEGTGQPGWFTWTLPSGRTYLSKPTSYLI